MPTDFPIVGQDSASNQKGTWSSTATSATVTFADSNITINGIAFLTLLAEQNSDIVIKDQDGEVLPFTVNGSGEVIINTGDAETINFVSNGTPIPTSLEAGNEIIDNGTTIKTI